MANMLDESYLADPDEPEDKEAAESGEPAAPEPDEPEQAAAPKLTPITRRQKARERDESILKELGGLKESLTKQGETYKQELERISRENAELRGHVQGLAQRPAYEPQRREEPAPDANKLLKEANALLDNKDFSGYQEKYADYILAKQAADPRFQQRAQPQGPAPINPMLQMVMTQYVDVVSNPVALTAAQAFDRVYASQGIPEGPERWKKAFEEGRRYLGKPEGKGPTFSTKNREVLAGVPRAGNSQRSDAGGEPGVTLSPLERKAAKDFRMSEKEYAQHLAAMYPDRVESV